MYEYLFSNYFKYFHNLKIILLMSNNFKDKIINFVKILYLNKLISHDQYPMIQQQVLRNLVPFKQS